MLSFCVYDNCVYDNFPEDARSGGNMWAAVASQTTKPPDR